MNTARILPSAFCMILPQTFAVALRSGASVPFLASQAAPATHSGIARSCLAHQRIPRNSRLHSRLFASLGQGFNEPPSETQDEDLQRWERMYAEGEIKEMMYDPDAVTSAEDDNIAFQPSEVRVISFDLDNTLWNTPACINAANDKLNAKLQEDGFELPRRVEQVMGDLFKVSKLTYCPLQKEESEIKGPVLLTQLRKDAIMHLATEHNGYSMEQAMQYADTTFQVWTDARHEAIPQNFAESVATTLQALKDKTTKSGANIVIGAITDGNSDPTRIAEIGHVFDFTVNAEEVGIAKPSKTIYLEAMRRAAQLPSLCDIFEAVDLDDINAVEASCGNYWVHVGDDFTKDIVAGKSMQMRTIWALELIRDKVAPDPANEKKKLTSSDVVDEEARLKEFIQTVSEKTKTELAIGPSDYLSSSIEDEFVDVRLNKFSDIVDVIDGWMIAPAIAKASAPSPADNPLSIVDTESKEPRIAPAIASEVKRESDQPAGSEKITTASAGTAAQGATKGPNGGKAAPKIIRLVRDAYSMDVPVLFGDPSSVLVKELMDIAQSDKSSGVFSFPQADVEGLRIGTTALFIKLEGTDYEFTREIFLRMTIADLLTLWSDDTTQIPTLSLSIRPAPAAPDVGNIF